MQSVYTVASLLGREGVRQHYLATEDKGVHSSLSDAMNSRRPLEREILSNQLSDLIPDDLIGGLRR